MALVVEWVEVRAVAGWRGAAGGSLVQESLNAASNFILSRVRWVLAATKPRVAHLRSTRHRDSHGTADTRTAWHSRSTLSILLPSVRTTLGTLPPRAVFRQR